MPALSDYARARKIKYLFDGVPNQSKILEVECVWLGRRHSLLTSPLTRHE